MSVLVSHALMLALALTYLLASVPEALSPEPMLSLPLPLLLANSHRFGDLVTCTLSLPLTLVLAPWLWRLGLGTSALLGMVGSPSDGACGPNGGWDELGL